MVLIEDIYDFLPKYPNIIQDKNEIFNFLVHIQTITNYY
jgi:hypothetical protein